MPSGADDAGRRRRGLRCGSSNLRQLLDVRVSCCDAFTPQLEEVCVVVSTVLRHELRALMINERVDEVEAHAVGALFEQA
jgi:hypothetical protein